MNFNNIWNRIKSPRPIFLILFYLIYIILVSATLCLVIFVKNQTFLHYILYAITAFASVYSVWTIIIYSTKIKQLITETLKKYKFTNNLLSNYGYRTVILSAISLLLNLTYVIFLGTFAIISKSFWYISITTYYLVLSIMKMTIFYSNKKHNSLEKQLATFRFCGIMFIFFNYSIIWHNNFNLYN